MAAIAYPSTLPCPQTSTVTPAERRALSQADRPREARTLSRDRLDYERITWPPMGSVLTAILLAWWRINLIYGGAWFTATWPLPRGMVAAVRKFREQPRWVFVPGGFWRISALCEVRGRGMEPATTIHNLRFEQTYSVPGWPETGSTLSANLFEFDPYASNGSFSNCIGVIPSAAIYDLPGDFEIEFEFNIGDPGNFGVSPGHLLFTRAEVNAIDYFGGYTRSGLWEFAANHPALAPSQLKFRLLGSGANVVGDISDSGWVKAKAARVGADLYLYIDDVLVNQTVTGLATDDLTGSFRLTVNGPYTTYSPLPNCWNTNAASYRNMSITRL